MKKSFALFASWFLFSAAAAQASTLNCTVDFSGSVPSTVVRQEIGEVVNLALGNYLDQTVTAQSVTPQGPIAIQSTSVSGTVVSSTGENWATLKVRDNRGSAATYDCRIEE